MGCVSAEADCETLHKTATPWTWWAMAIRIRGRTLSAAEADIGDHGGVSIWLLAR
jgi:hypothetical protein